MGKDIPIIENKNNQWIFLLPLTIMSVLAIALFSFFGINRSIWFDEACSVFEAGHDWEGIIREVKLTESSPPLYFLFLAVWIRIFGISELAVRSPSAIFYMLSLVAVYVLGKSIYNDRKTGLLCSFLYMLSPLAIKHAQNARMYSLLGLLVILSTLFFLRLFLLKNNSKKDLALYIIVNMIGIFTHYWFFFMIFSQIVSQLLLFPRSSFKKFSVAIFISVAPFLILWIPVFLSQANRTHVSWIVKPGIRELVSTLFDFCGGVNWKRAVLVYVAFLVLIVFKVVGFKIRFWNISALKEFIIQKQNPVFLIFLSVSLLVPLIISQAKPIYVPTRYTIIALPPFVMLVGSLLSRFGNSRIIIACCYILLIETSISFVGYRFTPKQCTDKSTTEYLIKHADNNDILIHTSLSLRPIDYYLSLMKSDKAFIKISFPQELALHPGWRDVNKMLSQKQILESDADSVVSYINDILIKNNNAKIWLLYGHDTEIGEILKHRLDTRFFSRKVKDLRKPFHKFYYNYTFRDDNCTFYNKLFVYKKR